jgi:hypothetical protein
MWTLHLCEEGYEDPFFFKSKGAREQKSLGNTGTVYLFQ